MTASDKSSVRVITLAERRLIVEALKLQQKSFERASKAAPDDVIMKAYADKAAQCHNLAMEYASNVIDF